MPPLGGLDRTAVGDGLPAAAGRAGVGHQGVEVDPAGRGEDDVGRAVAAAEIRPHRLGREPADGLLRSQDAAAQGVRGVVQGAAFLVGPERRLVVVHPDFFEDHLLFGVEVVLAERGAEDVGQEIDGGVLLLGEDRGVEDRVLLAGEGVVLGAHLVELAVDVVGRAAGRPLEGHVLQEVAHPGHLVRLVPRPRVDEEAHRRRVRLGIALRHDLQSVRQNRSTKLHPAPSVCAGQV